MSITMSVSENGLIWEWISAARCATLVKRLRKVTRKRRVGVVVFGFDNVI